MLKRKIGVFTIASKNYLAYVRVLLKSVAMVHPEYAIYLCLADTVDGAFDPSEEVFRVVPSDSIGISHFDDMAVRYDIMEFNTAVKPFMMQWLLDNTNLDSIIYLDPDIRVYSRLDRLEAVLATDASVVLTPHITRPVEDGKNPNDYHMLQAGVFNLGFIAINRCAEARSFIEWWGRRLETQACVDIAANLFTDQRWCDLAPCFLNKLVVFKRPGYNAAYWNLTERKIRQVRGQWRANGEPLAFFHFSGVNSSESVISKHQDRFTWSDVPETKPLFDDYRRSLLEEGWEQTRAWQYAYAKAKDGMPIPSIVRQLYRESHPTSKDFSTADISEQLLNLCNGLSGVFPFDPTSPITRIMEIIYRKRRDLQATFNLTTPDGRSAFRNWYESAAVREYNLPAGVIPVIKRAQVECTAQSVELQAAVVEEASDISRASLLERGSSTQIGSGLSHLGVTSTDISRAWDRLPASVKRALAPAMRQMLSAGIAAGTDSPTDLGQVPASIPIPMLATATGRIDALRDAATVPQLIQGRRFISVLMYAIWTSRNDLQKAFDLTTADGQLAFADWFDASAMLEYGIEAKEFSTPTASSKSSRSAPAAFSPRRGANLIGYAHAEIGMGEHVRMSAAALKSTAVEFGVVNFNVGVSSREGASLEHGKVVSGNPFAANVFHVNADQMFVAYRHLGHNFFTNRYNIGYWAWELANCPPEFRSASKLVDEIWAPSRFIQQAFGNDADVPVEYMPLCVELPNFTPLARSHFGLPQRAFVYLFTFDFLSFVDRKNPFAGIRAFKAAFSQGQSDVCLVLKVMHGEVTSPLWAKMVELIDLDPRIVVINQTLTRGEVLALLEMSDCFVSLHRSEGFGRGPAEAMYLGKPVIVTNYSGNTDFTLPDNSCLVDFTLIPVEEGQYPFHHGQQWADADVAHAAWYMKRLHSDMGYARGIGERGKVYIQANFNQRIIGARYESRLNKLGLV